MAANKLHARNLKKYWFKKGSKPWNEGMVGKKSHNYGRRLSGEIKQLLSGQRVGENNPMYGVAPWNKGKKGVQEGWNKGKHYLQIMGERNPRWNGGITPLRKTIRELLEYKIWRQKIFKRDCYTCRTCEGREGHDLNADHFPTTFRKILEKYQIKTVGDAIACQLLWDINNGRTLCIKCHKETLK